ncbi:MAG: hypothetical protein IJO93_05695 [Clostridia bacterium]|nr:hypothetical protein [Clostridia bacterium]
MEEKNTALNSNDNTKTEILADDTASAEKSDVKPEKKKEKELKGRRKLFADYQYRDVKTKKGKTVRRKVYTGEHFGYVIPSEYKKNEKAYIRRIKLTYLGFFLAATLMWILPSFALAPTAFGRSDVNIFYVLVPYMVCALPIMLIFLTLFEFLFTKGNRHERAFMEALTVNLKGQIVTFMISAAVTAISQVIFIILNYQNVKATHEVGFFVMLLATAAICFFWLRKQEKFPMQAIK